jgi:hypothetical protein
VALDVASAALLRVATNRSEGYVAGTPESTRFAVFEKGLDFGNNGEPPQRLTANLYGSKGKDAYPIVEFSYFMIDMVAHRPGYQSEELSCQSRKEVFDFLNWFYTSESVEHIADRLGLSALPQTIRRVMLD